MPSHEEQMKRLTEKMRQDFLEEPASFVAATITMLCACGYQTAELDQMPLEDRAGEFLRRDIEQHSQHLWRKQIVHASGVHLKRSVLEAMQKYLEQAALHHQEHLT